MRKAPTAVGIALSLLAAALLGTAGAAGSAPMPPVPRKVVLTVASDGSTVVAVKGELVVVNLSGDHLRWSQALAVGPSTTPVLAYVSGGITSTGASHTVFRVVGSGAADLEATGVPMCGSTGGCPQFVLLWHATVSVPVVDPPGPAA